MNGILTKSLESSGVQPSSIEIDGRGEIISVAFLVDGKHVVSTSVEGQIRRWRVEDGMEVGGTPIGAGKWVCNTAVSRNGKWIVSGTGRGQVQVWNVDDSQKVTEFKGHHGYVRAVDVSPDSTKIASGSDDKTACVWSLSTGQRLLGPWKHDDLVYTAKFSLDGRFIATATQTVFRIYDGRDGSLVVNVPIRVAFSHNHSLAWSSNSKQLFVVSFGKIICLDASTGATLSQWSIHGDEYNRIALASDGAFIAASSRSSVSFWDATTHEQIGSVIQHTGIVSCMAISANYDIAIGGGGRITLGGLCNIFPSLYRDTGVRLNQEPDLVLNEQRRREDSLNALCTKDERLGPSIHCPTPHVLAYLIH